MNGYVGERAKRRKRNIVIFFSLIFIVAFFIYIFPIIKTKETSPLTTIFPSEEEMQSKINSITPEELELKVFEQKQKINFKIKQLENLNLKNINLDKINQKLTLDLNVLRKIIKLNSNNQNIDKDDIQEKAILNLNKVIKKINIEKNKLIEMNTLLEKEYIQIDNLNINLNNSKKNLNNKVKKLEEIIKEKDLVIKILKDNSPHG